MIQHYYLGCPIWANKAWNGKFFTNKAKPKDYLRQYSKVFNTVEGNNTFYGLPKQDSLLNWKTTTPRHFRFSFKFPRQISHVFKLLDVQEETLHFLKMMAHLEEKIGILFLQLPPSFNKYALRRLDLFFQLLPQDFSYAVEVRNKDFFDNGEQENRFDDLLQKYGINRANFDTQTLHASTATDDLTQMAQGKKPRMPQRFTTTADMPMFRYAGEIAVKDNIAALRVIVSEVAQWIQAGKTPFVFMHSPGDVYAPHLAKQFHEMLQQHLQSLNSSIDLGTLPSFPSDDENALPQQMSLF